MSTFLNDVFSVTETIKDRPDLSKKIEVIRKEITKLKFVINESIKEKFIEIEPNIKPDEILVRRSEKLVNEMKILQSRIDDQVKVQLSSSAKELQNLTLKLQEYNCSLNLSSQLLQIHKGFKSIENYKTNQEKPYTTAALTLIELHSLVIERSVDIQELNIYEALKEKYYRVYDHFIEEVNILWQEKICWNEENESLKLKFLHIQCNFNELTDIIQALHCVNKLSKCIQLFSVKLLQNFIKPIVYSNCVTESDDKKLCVEVLDNKQLPNYTTVLNNLENLFKFLYHQFDIIVQNEECFMSRLSNHLFQEFSHILTDDCISKIIPVSISELETFESTVLEIEKFQNFLIKIKFIDENQKFLSKYTININDLYIDKKCEKLLDTARNIMKKDLHDSFKYEPKNLENFDNNDHFTDNIKIERKLSKFTFHLPACQISKSAQEILHLVEEMLEEACTSSDKYVLRLFYTSRNIFEMYAALIPEIHKSFLETIPQQAALFHNNCIYLAHHLLTLAYKYKKKMSIHSQDFSMMYIDQILLLRQVGSEYFLNHMKYQRDIIFNILQESGLSSIGQRPELPTTTERALRQCIRQLELLKTVWIEILPIKVYCRVLGCIVTAMINDISFKLLSIEDIPANIANELVTLFNMVVKRIPQIFPNPVLIEQHVQKWRLLKELIIILGASLKEIEDRWADGKGPLANELSSHHVKQFIRALFQNTERRSNLLSKIKDRS